MDDGLTLSRSQSEESHTARLIRSATLLFTRFLRYKRSFSGLFKNIYKRIKWLYYVFFILNPCFL